MPANTFRTLPTKLSNTMPNMETYIHLSIRLTVALQIERIVDW